MFLRLEATINPVKGASIQRLMDTIESLFSVFSNQAILRAEIRRLFDWLKRQGDAADGHYRGAWRWLAHAARIWKNTSRTG